MPDPYYGNCSEFRQIPNGQRERRRALQTIIDGEGLEFADHHLVNRDAADSGFQL